MPARMSTLGTRLTRPLMKIGSSCSCCTVANSLVTFSHSPSLRGRVSAKRRTSLFGKGELKASQHPARWALPIAFSQIYWGIGSKEGQIGRCEKLVTWQEKPYILYKGMAKEEGSVCNERIENMP